jgi:hypothetical protein
MYAYENISPGSERMKPNDPAIAMPADIGLEWVHKKGVAFTEARFRKGTFTSN